MKRWLEMAAFSAIFGVLGLGSNPAFAESKEASPIDAVRVLRQRIALEKHEIKEEEANLRVLLDPATKKDLEPICPNSSITCKSRCTKAQCEKEYKKLGFELGDQPGACAIIYNELKEISSGCREAVNTCGAVKRVLCADETKRRITDLKEDLIEAQRELKKKGFDVNDSGTKETTGTGADNPQ